MDYRSLRYPGVVSAAAAPGGGTTDYAVEIFHSALGRRRHGRIGSFEAPPPAPHYTCFLSPERSLPMIHMPDCLRASWELMTAPKGDAKREFA